MDKPDLVKIRAGQLIIVPPHGPGRVVSVQAQAGKILLVFPSGQQLELSAQELAEDARLPVDKAAAEEVRALLQEPWVQAEGQSFEQGFKERMSIVSAGELKAMARLLRKLYARQGPASPGERSFRQNLEDQVLVELGEVLGLSPALLRQELERAAQAAPEPEGLPPPAEAPPEAPPARPPAATPAAPSTPGGRVSCHRHPQSPATDTCPGCLKPMCDVCAMPNASGFLCPECNRRRERRLLGLKVAGFFLVSGLLLAAGVFFLSYYEPAFDYGPHEAKVHQLSKRLGQDPCDRVKMLKLAELLLEAGDHKRVVEDCQHFLSQCGEFNRLLWLTYEANKRMGQYDAAIVDVSRLIRAHPLDKDFRWWRAEVRARQRDWTGALGDYRQALGLQPKLRSIPYELLRAAKEAGVPCDGILAIEQLVYHHPEAAGDQELILQLERLYRDPACAGMAGQGFAALPLDEEAQVELPGGRKGLFLVDLRTSYCLLRQDRADELGLKSGEEFFHWDGRQVRKGRLARLEHMAVEEARAERVEVLVVKDLPDGVDGRLGLSFLSRFALRIDPDSNTLELSPKIQD